MKTQTDANQTNTSATQHIIIFGGTFSPTHETHVRVAREVCDRLHPTTLFFLPNKSPVLDKNATATPEHRLAMLDLAIAPSVADGYPFMVDRREIDRQTDSYMYLTIEEVRRQYPDAIISLLIGKDSYDNFHRWRNYETIQKGCNLIVVDRLGLESLSGLATCDESNPIQTLSGGVFHCATSEVSDCSSSHIRECLERGENPGPNFLSEAVFDYIQEHQLYDFPSRSCCNIM